MDGNSSMGTPLAKQWPELLRAFVNGSFARSSSLPKPQRVLVERQLQTLVRLALDGDKIWLNRWEHQQVPALDGDHVRLALVGGASLQASLPAGTNTNAETAPANSTNPPATPTGRTRTPLPSIAIPSRKRPTTGLVPVVLSAPKSKKAKPGLAETLLVWDSPAPVPVRMGGPGTDSVAQQSSKMLVLPAAVPPPLQVGQDGKHASLWVFGYPPSGPPSSRVLEAIAKPTGKENNFEVDPATVGQFKRVVRLLLDRLREKMRPEQTHSPEDLLRLEYLEKEAKFTDWLSNTSKSHRSNYMNVEKLTKIRTKWGFAGLASLRSAKNASPTKPAQGGVQAPGAEKSLGGAGASGHAAWGVETGADVAVASPSKPLFGEAPAASLLQGVFGHPQVSPSAAPLSLPSPSHPVLVSSRLPEPPLAQLPSPRATSGRVSARDKLKLRLERFARELSIHAPTTPSIVAEDLHSSKPLVGTCTVVEKRYLRLTLAPDPALVRPAAVLWDAFHMVKTGLERQPSPVLYAYACDQLKLIRQDLTVQHIRTNFTVQVYEFHARLAINNNDMGEFNQCLLQLALLYRLPNVTPRCESEFVGYRILYLLMTRRAADVFRVQSQLLPQIQDSTEVQLAMGLMRAQQLGDYHLFFSLFRQASPTAQRLIEQFGRRERASALSVICRAYRQVPVELVRKELALEPEEAWHLFVNDMGIGAYIEGLVLMCHKARAVVPMAQAV